MDDCLRNFCANAFSVGKNSHRQDVGVSASRQSLNATRQSVRRHTARNFLRIGASSQSIKIYENKVFSVGWLNFRHRLEQDKGVCKDSESLFNSVAPCWVVKKKMQIIVDTKIRHDYVLIQHSLLKRVVSLIQIKARGVRPLSTGNTIVEHVGYCFAPMISTLSSLDCIACQASHLPKRSCCTPSRSSIARFCDMSSLLIDAKHLLSFTDKEPN